MANTTNLDLVKPLGTDHALISQINGNMDKIDAYAGNTNSSLNNLADGLAIISVGDTHAAITSGQFVYVKGHNTLTEGLYVATANIAANGALSSSNLTADSSGGLNALSSKIGKLDGSTPYAEGDANSYTETGIYHVGLTSNSPTGSALYGDLFVQATGVRITQMFTIFSGETYVRQRSNATTWGAWDSFALNSKLTWELLQGSTWLASAETGSGAGVFAYKNATMVCLDLRTVSRSHQGDEVIFTLPEGIRPKSTIDVPCTINGYSGVVRIESNGQGSIWTLENSTASGRVYLYCMYPI